jgi:hypothetical protein
MLESVVGNIGRQGWRAGAAAILAALALVGCRKVDNGAFCCATVDSCAPFGVTAPNGCAGLLVCDDTAHACIDPGHGGHCSGPQDCAPVTPLCVDQTCVQCQGPTDCTAALPVCAANACGECSAESDCAGYVADHLGHCATAGAKAGACVACRDAADCADPNAPVCDQSACRGCTADSECASAVCDTGTGACVAEDTVLYVKKGASGLNCTKTAPCGLFMVAIGRLDATHKTIKAEPGDYVEDVTLGAVTGTVRATGVNLSPKSNNLPAVLVTDGANVGLVGIHLTGAGGTGGDGLRCQVNGAGPPPAVAISHAKIDGNTGQGIDATNCALTVTQSLIAMNAGGGVSITGSAFTITNNMIVENGNTSAFFGGVAFSQISSGGAHTFRFNTVSKNNGGAGNDTGVTCAQIAAPITLGDSIVYGNITSNGGRQVGGNNCNWTYSDIGDATIGTGNVSVDPMFVSEGAHDFHLMAASPLEGAADPAATTAIDFDDEVRPQGTGRDIGADELKP